MSFVKLHGSILDSSVWSQPHAVRIVWIAMLAMADENGVVSASVDGLARRAVVTIAECEQALAVFLGPDQHSRDGTTGERIERVPGGWLILNHKDYRDRQTRQQALTAARVARHREKHLPASRTDGPVEETRFGKVYVIQRGEHGPVKVGFSANPMARIAELQIALPEKLRLLTMVDGHLRTERRIHLVLSGLGIHLGGEWYAHDIRILKIVTDVTAEPNADVTPRNETSPSEAEAEAEADQKQKQNRGRAERPESVPEELWKDFLALRARKRAPLTATALKMLASQAAAAGWTLADAIAECCARGWTGFRAEWVQDRGRNGGQKPVPIKDHDFRQGGDWEQAL
jgi:hypothetical protein